MYALQRAAGNAAVSSLFDASRVEPDHRASSSALPPPVANTVKTGGVSLESSTRREMEKSFGHDFGGVRVHTDDTAGRSAQAVDASAYTVGPHVVFAPGQYRPHDTAGRRLLAHELAHVVQQSRGGGPAPGFRADSPLERSADHAAAGVSHAGAVRVAGGSAPGLARQQAGNQQQPGGGIHVTGRFTASAEILRRAKQKSDSGDVAGARKQVDQVVGFLKNIKYDSWKTLKGLNGLTKTDIEMIASIGISAIQHLGFALAEGRAPDRSVWERAFREYLYARPAIEVLCGDVPVSKSKFAKDIEKGTDMALKIAGGALAAAIIVPIVIGAAPLVAEFVAEAGVGALARLTVLVAENPQTANVVAEFVVGKIIQVAETHALTFTVGEIIMVGLNVYGTVNMGSGRVTKVNGDGSAEIEITQAPQVKTGGGAPVEQEGHVGTGTQGGASTPKTGGGTGGTTQPPTTDVGTGTPPVNQTKTPAAMPSTVPGTKPTTGGGQAPPPKPTITAAPVEEEQQKPPPSNVTPTQVAPTKDVQTDVAPPKNPPTNVAPSAKAAQTNVAPPPPDAEAQEKPPTQAMKRPAPNSVYSATSKTVKASKIPNPEVIRARPRGQATQGDDMEAEVQKPDTAAQDKKDKPAQPAKQGGSTGAADQEAATQGAQTNAPPTKEQQLLAHIRYLQDKQAEADRDIVENQRQDKTQLSAEERADLPEKQAAIARQRAQYQKDEAKAKAELDKLGVTPYYEARAYSMSPEARRDAITRTGGTDEVSGKRPEKISVDHLISVDELTQMEGWNKLTKPQQRDILSRQKNLVPMDRSLNSSKGNKSWANWAFGREHYGNEAADKMLAREQEMRAAFRQEIKEKAAANDR